MKRPPAAQARVSSRDRRRAARALCAAVLLSACAPDIAYDPPVLTLAAAFSGAPHALSQGTGRWEIGFSDPVLDRLVAVALQENPGFASARARLAEAEAQARAAGVPASGAAEASLALDDGGGRDLNLGLGARIGPGGAATRAAAGARAGAARFDAEEARRQLLEDLVIAYVDLRYYQQLLEYRRADLASRRQTLAQIERQLEAGSATEVDELSARALLTEAQGRLPGVEAQAVRQQNRLSTLVGRPVGTLGVDLSFPRAQPAPQGMADLGVPADLLRARPDIRRAERLYAAAVADIAAARAQLYPSLDLSGLIRVPLDAGASATSLVAGLSLPVFSRPALEAGVDAAEARAVAAFEDWRATVLIAVEEVESALAARSAAERAAASSAEVVTLRRRALDLARRLLTQGSGVTALEILEREQELSAARTTLAQDRRDVALAHIRLRAALGLDRLVAAQG